jgi:hemerythrin-like metal-binding protein
MELGILDPIDPTSLALGHPVIDLEHRELCELYNELVRGRGGDLGSIILRLDEYARRHFVVEEEFYRAYDWPGLPRHRLQHREFLERVAALRAMQLPADGAVPRTVLAWIRSWLVGHIDREDRDGMAFLRSRGEQFSVAPGSAG